LVVDVQEKLSAAMPKEALQTVERNIGILCEAARRFELPVVWSEQYPRGLGPTNSAVRAALEPLGGRVQRLEKTVFSVVAAPEFASLGQTGSRDQWILCGMETHVCIYQTVRDLVARGATVHVPEDAVCSRAEHNWKRGLTLCEAAGATITSTETVVFDLLGSAGSEDFKALSRMVR
jgi:nicotinamidase-related amidase